MINTAGYDTLSEEDQERALVRIMTKQDPIHFILAEVLGERRKIEKTSK
jgi:hypothetical protein